ncbi:MAG TPA: hypothetical protein VHT96_12095 [Clostridia bacterium]|nr:hypothetical protein [Clostridia bacterium]
MRIESSSVQLYGASTSVEKTTRDESLKAWVGNTRPAFEGEKDTVPFLSDQEGEYLVNRTSKIIKKFVELNGATLQLSPEGRKALADQIADQIAGELPDTPQAGVSDASCVAGDDEDLLQLSDKDKQKIYLLERMIEFLTGKKFKFVVPKNIELDGAKAPPQAQGQAPQRSGWGLEYDYHEAHYEKQTVSFSADGTVKTADGKEISFDLDLNMSREFASRLDISLRAGDAARVDPLVVNFGSPSASLTDNKISFDIDSDGTEDQISFVKEGSGFLALDINNDGMVNNGSELFGPGSGNGFADLANYDADGNNWIDENDDIYDKLRIWTKDENGNDQLFALGAKGIGAIFLGNVGTSYALKNDQNKELGSIARSGIFLTEKGVAGTIQHVDLTV